MGGAGSSSTAMYFIGTSNQIYTASPLPLPSSLQPTQTGTISTGIGTYDCAREGTNNSVGDLWVATNQTTNSIRAYNAAGTQVNAIDLVSTPRGLAYSAAGGHRYLWASSTDGNIYQIDLDYGLGVEEGSGGTPVGLSVGENPFEGMTTLVGTGFAAGAAIEIFDVSGRKVVEAPFQDSFSWSGASVVPGVYLVVVSDPTGAMASLSVTRL